MIHCYIYPGPASYSQILFDRGHAEDKPHSNPLQMHNDCAKGHAVSSSYYPHVVM